MATPSGLQRALDAVRRFARGLQAHEAFATAASIAFWFFLSAVPLLVLLGFLVSQVARARGVDALVTPLLDVVPETAEDIVRRELEHMAGSTATVAPLGVIGYLWTASSGLHSLMDVFERAARARRRPWWKQRTIAVAWVIGGLAMAVLLAWLLVRVDAAMHAHDPPPPQGVSASANPIAPAGSPTLVPARPDPSPAPASPSGSASAHAPDHLQSHGKAPVSRARGAFKHRLNKALHTPLEQALAAALMLVVGMVFLAGFYRFAVEHPPGVRRRVWPGTFTAVVLWLAVSWIFGVYATSMSNYALYYGSLAAVAVLLIWMYLTSLSLVVGAELNMQLEGVHDERKSSPSIRPKAPARSEARPS